MMIYLMIVIVFPSSPSVSTHGCVGMKRSTIGFEEFPSAVQTFQSELLVMDRKGLIGTDFV